MKKKKYLSMEEVMKALLDGKKIHVVGSIKDAYLFLKNGRICSNCSVATMGINPNIKYEIYNQPRKYMNFINAVKKMEQGYNLAIDDKDYEGVIYFIDDNDFINDSCGGRIFYDEVISNKWYVVEEKN